MCGTTRYFAVLQPADYLPGKVDPTVFPPNAEIAVVKLWLEARGCRSSRLSPVRLYPDPHSSPGAGMKTLICGSIAYDNIMVFNDQFKNHILPDQIHILMSPSSCRNCVGNMAAVPAISPQPDAARGEPPHHGHRRR